MKVLLVDDHPLVLSALQVVIQSIGSDTTVVGVDSAAAARDALQRDSDFDLVLLDLVLGDADGFDVLVEFRDAYPAVPVVGCRRPTAPATSSAPSTAVPWASCPRSPATVNCTLRCTW